MNGDIAACVLFKPFSAPGEISFEGGKPEAAKTTNQFGGDFGDGDEALVRWFCEVGIQCRLMFVLLDRLCTQFAELTVNLD